MFSNWWRGCTWRTQVLRQRAYFRSWDKVRVRPERLQSRTSPATRRRRRKSPGQFVYRGRPPPIPPKRQLKLRLRLFVPNLRIPPSRVLNRLPLGQIPSVIRTRRELPASFASMHLHRRLRRLWRLLQSMTRLLSNNTTAVWMFAVRPDSCVLLYYVSGLHYWAHGRRWPGSGQNAPLGYGFPDRGVGELYLILREPVLCICS